MISRSFLGLLVTSKKVTITRCGMNGWIHACLPFSIEPRRSPIGQPVWEDFENLVK
jgi:hypothetical protein